MQSKIESMVVPGVAELKPYQPGKPIEALKRELNIHQVVKLASNENPVGPSPKAIEAIRRMSLDFHFYPEGSAYQLKQRLSEVHQRDVTQITTGNGSDEIFGMILKCFVQSHHEVMASQYAFAAYAIATKAHNAKFVEVPAKAWGCDLEAMLHRINENTRVIFIANPNNPTGTWIDTESLRQFLKAVPSHVLVVVDQAYFEYMQTADYPNAADFLDEFENLLVTFTFSKIYGLAGLRVGYCLSSAKIADYLNRVRLPFNVNQVAQVAATAALGDEEHLACSLQTNQQGMLQLREGIAQLGWSSIEYTANFLTVEVPNAQAIDQQLLQQGIIVRPLLPYGMSNHLRITVGLKRENEILLNALNSLKEVQYD